MANCKYTYKGITYNSKEEFISQVVNPQFLGKTNTETVSEIYSKLGNKTKEGNVVIQSVYQTAGVQYAKSIGGVFSLRINGTNNQFGNPFSSVESEIQKGLIRTKSTKESVEKYIEWVLSPTTTIKPEQHGFIREWLQSGKLKNRPIVYYKELGEPSHATALDYLINRYNWNQQENKLPTKTRRIIEVQSDLFQQGRDKNELVQRKASYSLLTEEEEIERDDLIRKHNQPESDEDVNTFSQERLDFLNNKLTSNKEEVFGSKNQFLQLLNKDNNWVTFFVKSIIQDSAKKGYEKVLFPTGNTSAKVEGHTTLEEFKKQKEDRIKELENKVQNIKERGYLGGLNSVEQSDQFGDYTQYLDQNNKGEFEEISKEEYDKRFKEYSKQELEKTNNEITQLKQELERIETEGFAALKPIYNFYENTITNILKKQGYKPSLFTDEFGNTWNEVFLKNEYNSEILLSVQETKADLKGESDEIFDKGFSNIREYVEYIANNNEPLSPLANNLLRFKNNIPVILTRNLELTLKLNYSENRTVVAIYDPIKKEIKVNPYIDRAKATLLHEYIHAITYNHIKLFPDSKEVKELSGLLDHARTFKNITEKYPLENLDEFIAGIFTNSRFIYELQQIPYKGTNVLTKLIEWFSKLFKFTPKQESLFEEVFYKAEQLLDKIYQVENSDFEVDVQSSRSEIQLENLLIKYGTGFGNEINPQSEWGKLTSDVAKANKDFGLNLTIYQAPNGKWYLRQTIISTPNIRSVANIIENNAKETNLGLSELGEGLLNNWSDYFEGYSDLTETEKKEIINLIEKGLVELTCKI